MNCYTTESNRPDKFKWFRSPLLSFSKPTAWPYSCEFSVASSLPNTAFVSISFSGVSRRFFAVCISEPLGRRMRPKMSKISSSFWGEPRSDQLAEDLKILETSLLVNFFLHRLREKFRLPRFLISHCLGNPKILEALRLVNDFFKVVGVECHLHSILLIFIIATKLKKIQEY